MKCDSGLLVLYSIVRFFVIVQIACNRVLKYLPSLASNFQILTSSTQLGDKWVNRSLQRDLFQKRTCRCFILDLWHTSSSLQFRIDIDSFFVPNYIAHKLHCMAKFEYFSLNCRFFCLKKVNFTFTQMPCPHKNGIFPITHFSCQPERVW